MSTLDFMNLVAMLLNGFLLFLGIFRSEYFGGLDSWGCKLVIFSNALAVLVNWGAFVSRL